MAHLTAVAKDEEKDDDPNEPDDSASSGPTPDAESSHSRSAEYGSGLTKKASETSDEAKPVTSPAEASPPTADSGKSNINEILGDETSSKVQSSTNVNSALSASDEETDINQESIDSTGPVVLNALNRVIKADAETPSEDKRESSSKKPEQPTPRDENKTATQSPTETSLPDTKKADTDKTSNTQPGVDKKPAEDSTEKIIPTEISKIAADAKADPEKTTKTTAVGPNKLGNPAAKSRVNRPTTDGTTLDGATAKKETAELAPTKKLPVTSAATAGADPKEPQSGQVKQPQKRHVSRPKGRSTAPKSPPQKRNKIALLGAIPVVLVVAFFAVWAIDQNIRGETVARNTEINGVDISGLNGEALRTAIGKSADGILLQEIDVVANEKSVQTTPKELGAVADVDSITVEALRSHREGFVLKRPFSWASTFIRVNQIEPQFKVDGESMQNGIPTVLAPLVNPVIETTIQAEGSGFSVVPGEEGQTIDADEIAAELPDALAKDQPVLELTSDIGQPEITVEQAERAADDADNAIDDSMAIQLLDQFTTLEPVALRQMVYLDSSDEGVTWAFDNELAVNQLKGEFTNIGTENDEARFTLVNGTPVVLPVSSAIECCDETTAERLKEHLLNPSADAETLLLEPEFVAEDPTAEVLTSYGIVEEVSSFTTPHEAGGNRVKNIQRFADLIRGQTIPVGGELSLNDTVGERTIAKGFFPDGAISEGVVEDQIGGGISQFATTFFNAAFFSGVEIQKYQFHTLAIGSRYPLGRESTIDFPSVDVKVKNTTEHAILVWTSYTSSSITVKFYSVKHLNITDINGQELAFDVYQPGGRDTTFPPVVTPDRECQVYTTTRNTEFPSGEVLTDSFSGFYRPSEGLDCDGELTAKAQAELDKEEEEKKAAEEEAANDNGVVENDPVPAE